MLLLLSSPLMGTSGIVPNFCLEMSEDECLLSTGGAGSSFWNTLGFIKWVQTSAPDQDLAQGQSDFLLSWRPAFLWIRCHGYQLREEEEEDSETDLSFEEAGDPVPQVGLTGATQVPKRQILHVDSSSSENSRYRRTTSSLSFFCIQQETVFVVNIVRGNQYVSSRDRDR